MNSSEFPPLTVVPYSKDFLVDFVRLKTGWDQRSEVYGKDQLTYLCNYLSVDHIDAKTIVVESEYVDRHYLEDYSEYYARCFPSHPRMCSRVHFFSRTFEERDFTTALANNSKSFWDDLSEAYIGFAVVRPIPHTFIARLCIKPYEALVDNDSYRVITKRNDVSLFGIHLNVQTAPFVEQDKVVAACATSALWVLFGASPDQLPSKMPSPSAITKAATRNSSDGSRTFPTRGLTLPQITASLQHFGLEPHPLVCDSDSSYCTLKEGIHAYVTNGMPVLLGGRVYEDHAGEWTLLGPHLVCALGYHIGETHTRTDRMPLLSHSIDKLFVHDDRFGPYLRLDAPTVSATARVNGATISGFEMSIYHKPELKQLFVPDFALVGLNSKVRISYEEVRNVCGALWYYMCYAQRDLADTIADPSLESDVGEYYSQVLEALRIATSGAWNITLTTSQQIKKDLRDCDTFVSFNGTISKNALLLRNLPRHIWRCRIHQDASSSGKPYSDILIDATEIPQGRILIGYISFADQAEAMWKSIESSVNDREWQEYQVHPPEAKHYIGAVLKFFSEHKQRSYLNSIYGHLQLPRRTLKVGETDNQYNLSLRKDALIKRRGDSTSDWSFLAVSKKYIWVIDEAGDLVIGEDIEANGDFKGHPTLMDGKPGRIAGELLWNVSSGKWLLNLKSRAYLAPLLPTDERYLDFLRIVIQNSFVGLNVEPAIFQQELSGAASASILKRT